MKMNRLLLENIYMYDFEKSVNNIKIHNWYLLTFAASKDAIEKMQSEGIEVISCIVLDEYSKAFSEDSMIFSSYSEDKKLCKEMCQYYGEKIKPEYPLGFDDCQYMFGMYYTISNNTLPIFWSNNNWKPLFIRHEKNYSGGVNDVFGRFI